MQQPRPSAAVVSGATVASIWSRSNGGWGGRDRASTQGLDRRQIVNLGSWLSLGSPGKEGLLKLLHTTPVTLIRASRGGLRGGKNHVVGVVVASSSFGCRWRLLLLLKKRGRRSIQGDGKGVYYVSNSTLTVVVLLKGNLQPPTLVVDGGGRLPGRNDDEVDLRTGGRQNKKKECFHSWYCCSTLFCSVHTPHISMLFDLFHVIKKL